MIAFLFFILISGSLAAFYYLKNKIAAERKQILLLKYENKKLKRKIKSLKNN